MNSSDIRQAFLDFFRSKKHEIVTSAPMVVRNDPTLMFTNAGMNQFKDIFLGNHEPKFSRIADTQKCLRVSGKHNDLEEVGHDTYHHTMFEMLGNWSFGDYFKQEAIAWGWEFLTSVVNIDKDSLYVTVFEGDESEGLAPDHESFEIWKQYLPEDRILFGSKKDNFWEMGDSGPCGPCSEIHADIRGQAEKARISGRKLVNTGNPHVIEIWNLVFIQFNRMSDGKLAELPAKHVDTGMGFERLCMLLQGKKSNYDTDVFQPVISKIARMAGTEYGRESRNDIAMRVVADHLRAVSFAIADGQLPSNVKAGYVIRRILRRAIRYGYAFLGFREPFIHELVETLAEQMGPFFPELTAQKQLIINVVKEEESAFLRTLANGIHKFNSYIGQHEASTVKSAATGAPGKIIDGDFAFELFDTYGFPIDLTELMAREIGWSIDMEGFRKGLEAQKTRSRQDATIDTSDWVTVNEDNGLPEFAGYDFTETESRITRYRQVSTKGEQFYHIILDRTPFYAESGGQVGDRGQLISDDEVIDILNTIKENDLIIHIAPMVPSDPSRSVVARVDREKRRNTANNHSATHLMHAALRKVLGSHVEQKGSLVDENRLRFDFTHFARMTNEDIRRVEMLVNAKIRENIHRGEDRAVPIDQARAKGAMALFGEKYGDTVRVISFDPGYSIELCGGTHVDSTGSIGLFRIVSEGAIAAGIRRIEAITGEKALDFVYQQEDTIHRISDLLKNPKELWKGVANLIQENLELKKEVAELGKLKLQQLKAEYLEKVQHYNGINFLAMKTDLDAETTKTLAWELSHSVPDLFLVFASESEGKAQLTVMLSENLVKVRNLHAGNIIRELSKEIRGGGGGQPHIATAGGKYPDGIPAALAKARTYLSVNS